MKSIKEKAIEYSSGNMNLDRQQVEKQALETGANYVIDELEKECKRVAQLCKSHIENPVDEEDKVDSWARLDEMEYMLKFIEQLKK